MKNSRIYTLVLLALSVTCGLTAGTVFPPVELPPGDPTVDSRPPADLGGGGLPAVQVNGFSFGFITPSGTSPSGTPCSVNGADTGCDFINASGSTWRSLHLVITPGAQLTSCFITITGFDTCSFTQSQSNMAMLDYSGGAGIPNGGGIGFTVAGWDPGTSFAVTANGVPEPMASGLAVTGLAAFALRAIWQRRRRTGA